MKTALLTVLLVVASSLAAFNAWQLLAPRAADAPAETSRTGLERSIPNRPAATDPTALVWARRPARKAFTEALPQDPMVPGPSKSPPGNEPADRGSATGTPAGGANTSSSSKGLASRSVPADPPRVSAILWSRSRPLAVVGGQVVAPGETVGELRVTRIRPGVVHLERPSGEELVLSTPDGPGPGGSR